METLATAPPLTSHFAPSVNRSEVPRVTRATITPVSQVPPTLPPLPPLPSLPLLLEVMEKERDKCQTHFESLDTKAGIILAFDGVLIPLTFNIEFAFRAASISLSLTSAAFALAAYRPREFPVFNPDRLRTYIVHETTRTQLFLHDTSMEMINQARALLKKKARMLGFSLILLFAAAAFLGIGAIFNQTSGSSDGGPDPIQSAAPAAPAAHATSSAESSSPGRSAAPTATH